eukprot:TRINITY_DN15196_c0_g1_i2.p1 TRINITY_DN15196_c0_g1~~TRINITY_DN15196_c0_g1_i2.p1  ORF type:complete len:530 (+),score=232.36 TRINITY_DN15196_c0_g1_i2:82-1590(+)
MALAAAAAIGALGAAQSHWQGLHDGLHAWEQFGFDRGFTYEVRQGTKVLFHYPPPSPDLAPSPAAAPAVDISINGTRSELLRNVTAPFVSFITEGKDPGNPASADTTGVSRHELLQRGAGLTLADIAAVEGTASAAGDKWQPLRDGLDAWAKLQWDMNFTFNVGDASGTLFTYTKGTLGMKTRVAGASLSKWPAAMTVAGLVADGTLSFDDKVNKHLDWWSKDPADLRSEVTLRHLLTFQSGYLSDGYVLCAMNASADYLGCAKKLYESMKIKVRPGAAFSYLSCHLQFAGAVAVAASGLNPKQLFEKYLYNAVGMTDTTWGEAPFVNPQFATGITTTGADFEQMLRKMLTYEFLGREVLREAERDWSAPPVSPCGDGWFGHYGMGHWFDCLGYAGGQKMGASAALPQYCLEEDIQAGPGAFGFYPLIDRKRGYYMQIVLMEDSACRSEVPEYLRAAAKPMVDDIVAGRAPTKASALSRDGGVTLAELTDIYNYIPPQCKPQ